MALYGTKQIERDSYVTRWDGIFDGPMEAEEADILCDGFNKTIEPDILESIRILITNKNRDQLEISPLWENFLEEKF